MPAGADLAAEARSAEVPSAPFPISAPSPCRTCSSPVPRRAVAAAMAGMAATAPMAARAAMAAMAARADRSPAMPAAAPGTAAMPGTVATAAVVEPAAARSAEFRNLGTLNVVGATAVLFGDSADGGDGGKGGSAGAAGMAGQAGTPGTGNPKPPANRAPTAAEVTDWLEKLGMSEYAQRFAENRIDLSVLPELTDQHLKDLGIPSSGQTAPNR